MVWIRRRWCKKEYNMRCETWEEGEEGGKREGGKREKKEEGCKCMFF